MAFTDEENGSRLAGSLQKDAPATSYFEGKDLGFDDGEDHEHEPPVNTSLLSHGENSDGSTC